MTAILVPTDLSPASQNATDYAGYLCRELKAKMILLHVYMLPVPVAEIPYVMVSADEIQKASENALKKEAIRIYEITGIEVEWIVRLGLASDEIKDIEIEKNIDLIILGMKGGGEFNKLIGSTTIAVIRKSHKPVLVIPQQAKFHPYKLISYATDFTYITSAKCFEPLKLLARQYKTDLIAVNVQKPGKNMTSEQKAGKERISFLLEDIQHKYHVIEDNDIEHSLQRFIEEQSPDLLALVSHKHTILERLFGTHHTKAMIYQTHIPALVLQDKD